MNNVESIINYARSLVEGEVQMVFSADVPYVQMQPMAAATVNAPSASKPTTIETAECQDVGNSDDFDDSAYNQFGVLGAVFGSLGYKYNQTTGKYDVPETIRANLKMHVLVPPAHGKLLRSEKDFAAGGYSYKADQGYVGQDSFTIMVDTLTRSGKEIHYKFKFNLAVVKEMRTDDKPPVCESMKFSSAPNSPVSIAWDLPLPVDFADLSSVEVGQTTGPGSVLTFQHLPRRSCPGPGSVLTFQHLPRRSC